MHARGAGIDARVLQVPFFCRPCFHHDGYFSISLVIMAFLKFLGIYWPCWIYWFAFFFNIPNALYNKHVLLDDCYCKHTQTEIDLKQKKTIPKHVKGDNLLFIFLYTPHVISISLFLLTYLNCFSQFLPKDRISRHFPHVIRVEKK